MWKLPNIANTQHELACAYTQLAKSIDAKSDDAVWFRLVAVDVGQAKSALMSQALTARKALQNWIQQQWHTSNQAAVAK